MSKDTLDNFGNTRTNNAILQLSLVIFHILFINSVKTLYNEYYQVNIIMSTSTFHVHTLEHACHRRVRT